MIYDREILTKNSLAHAIIFPKTEVDILIPTKCVIEDVKMGGLMPIYIIKVIKFYDDFAFLKKYLYGQTIRTEDGITRKLWFPKEVTTRAQLEEWISTRNINISVEAPFVTKMKIEMMDNYNAMSDYLIMRQLRYFRDVTTRKEYRGEFRSESHRQWKDRMRNAFISNFKSDEEFYKRIDEV